MNFKPEKTVFLVDGSSFLYRAYYGTRPLHTSKGVPVQAVYSFVRMIKKLIDKFEPQYLALVWDSKGPTTRHEIYHEYKATRQAPPSDLFMQKEYIVKFAELIHLRQIEKQGLEADDLLYSVARDWNKEGNNAVLITSDKDMGQALNDKTVIYDAFKDIVIDEQVFEAKMGFPVEKLPFYFALLGDTSDNIPGVRGIGEKGATSLVQKYDSLPDLYEHLDEIEKKKTKEALETQKDNAFLSEKLFLLQYHPTKLKKSDFEFFPENWKLAHPLFIDLDFKSLLKDIEGSQPLEQKIAAIVAKYNYQAVRTTEELKKLCTELAQKKVWAMDTETLGLRPLQDPIIGISFCTQEGTAYYIPFGHNVADEQLKREEVLAALKPLLEDQHHKKYLHNVKFDQLVLYNAGVRLRGVAFDSLIAANLLTEDWQRIGLKYLSEFYFDEPMINFADVVTQFKRKDFSYVPLDEATQYAAGDAHQTLKVVRELQSELDNEPTIKRLYELIEFPLIEVLFKMEAAGIFVDVGMLENLNRSVTKQLLALEDEILSLVGALKGTLNLNSPKQVEQLLFYQLKLPPQKKSSKGSYSTDQEVLEVLQAMHPVPGLILKYRELFKLKSTYIEALPMYVNPQTNRIHTTFSQTGVATGRLSSYDPNLQNIPVTPLGIEIRAAFKPEDGHSFLSADYSQIELRVLAELSHDQNLIHAFLSGHDIHAQTAARLFNVPLEAVSNEQRQIGKRINFSILYGLTPFGLSKDLGIPFSDAKKYIETYFEQYPGVSTWMEEVVEETKKHGYVQTYWGRRRYIPAIYEKNRALYEEARRVAINTKAQGTAAEIMKLGMITVDKLIEQQNIDAHIVLQIHDELLISVHDTERDRAEKLIKNALESVVQWKIPLKVTTRFGKDWKEVTK